MAALVTIPLPTCWVSTKNTIFRGHSSIVVCNMNVTFYSEAAVTDHIKAVGPDNIRLRNITFHFKHLGDLAPG